MNGKSIFLKYWIVSDGLIATIPYKVSILPGLKNGVSGSVIAGSNIGIIRDLSEEKRKETYEVFKFLTSKYFKRKMFEEGLGKTSVTELLDDEEICNKTSCDLLKEIQFTVEPTFLKNGPEDYRKRYKKYIYEYLYENKSLEDTVKKVNDIIKVYRISLSTEDSYVGLIFFIIFTVLSILMFLSLFFIFVENFEIIFKFLSLDFWIISVIGSIMIFCIPFISYGRVNQVKCFLKILLLSLGYTLSVCPALHKLIAQHPGQGKIALWINENKYLFLFSNILIDLFLNSISLANPYVSKSVFVQDGESFEICEFDNINLIIIFTYKFIIILLFLYLIFVEWNILDTIYDVRFTVLAIYSNILTFILIYVFTFFEIKHYEYSFIIPSAIISTTAISNYLFLYGIRIIFKLIKKGDPNFELVNRESYCRVALNDVHSNPGNAIESTPTTKTDRNVPETNDNENVIEQNKKLNFIKRTIKYHYAKDTRYSNSNINISNNTFTSSRSKN